MAFSILSIASLIIAFGVIGVYSAPKPQTPLVPFYDDYGPSELVPYATYLQPQMGPQPRFKKVKLFKLALLASPFSLLGIKVNALATKVSALEAIVNAISAATSTTTTTAASSTPTSTDGPDDSVDPSTPTTQMTPTTPTTPTTPP